ncbi:MAG TPA: TIGR01458 family HAD-type hydrolase [Caldilineaceae bacterium]|nr:TIGR01458 family HAD-type hydrolase [Caldilineaceae bacterium]
MSNLLSTVDGLLIDVEGVLLRGSQVQHGAHEVVETLRRRGIPHRIVTNTTIYCRYTMLARLRALGFPIEIDELFTATYAAAKLLREQKARSYYPLLLPDAQLEFTGIAVDEDNPEYVVIGDMGPSFDFVRLNRAMRAVLNGARLIALHKRRLWRTEQGLSLDAGPFVVALEYATGSSAEVVGKPSPAYFRMVLDQLGLPPKRVAMLGDDIETDVRGAQRMGMQGWLVKTGRFRKEDLGRGIWPDRVLESIGDIITDL